MRLLLVEDDAICAYLLSETLKAAGFEVPEVFASGEEAVAYAAQTPVDAAIMDVNLDGMMTGLEAAAIINQAKPIPVLFVSGSAPNEVTHYLEDHLYCDYLPKPVHPNQIIDRLNSLLASMV